MRERDKLLNSIHRSQIGFVIGGKFIPKIMFNFRFKTYIHDPTHNIKVSDVKSINFKYIFLGVTWGFTKKLGLIGSAVLTFIGHWLQTNKQTEWHTNYVYRFLLLVMQISNQQLCNVHRPFPLNNGKTKTFNVQETVIRFEFSLSFTL